jgi:hypothetical protein
LSNSIQQHSKLLNPQPVPTTMALSISLSLEAVAGTLLVTQQFAPGGKTTTEPYIVVVAAPALATLGKVDATHPPSISLSDFWNNTVLASFGLPINHDLHCPLATAAEGLSHKVTLPGIMDFMQDTQPFHYGEQVAPFVNLATELHY